MKRIESKLKSKSGRWISPVLLIIIAIFAIAVVSPTVALAAKFTCEDKPDHPQCNDGGGGGGGGDTDGPDPNNLARASFTNFGDSWGGPGGGISIDGQDSCTVDRGSAGGIVEYDYWAWQESIISPDISIHELDTGHGGSCDTHDNRSDVSGGGRWFLITTAGSDDLFAVQRWLVFDFSDSTDETACPDLDGDEVPSEEEPFYNHLHLGPIYTPDKLQPGMIDSDPCVDHVTVRFPADRILKSNASTQKFAISIRHQPDSQYWPPWGSVQYLEPLYVRAPSEHGLFAGRDCTLMSTRPAPAS
jgi:hypothetical protein